MFQQLNQFTVNAAPPVYSTADHSEVKTGHGPIYTTGTFDPPPCNNMLDYMQNSVERNPNGEFLGHRPKDENGVAGEYAWHTYEQVYARIKNVAAGLAKLEMMERTSDGDERVLGIYMKNRPEWLVAQYAAMYCGGFSVALYDTLGADAIQFILNQTQLSTVVCTSAELNKVIHAKTSSAPFLKHVIVCDTDEKPATSEEHELQLWTLSEVEIIGAENPTQPTTPQEEDIYCLIYTSGTTGEPKGVPLRHRNIIHAIEANKERMCHGKGSVIFEQSCVHFSYLPLAHSIEHLCEATIVAHAAKIAFYQGDTTKILDDLALVRPQFFGVVPRLLNKIYDKIVHGTEATGGLKAWAFRSALQTKFFFLKRGIRQHAVLDRLIFSKIQRKVGLDRCRLMIVGSAPLANDVMDFFRVLFDFPVMEAYGLSEICGIATMNLQSQYVAGDVGPPLAKVQTKLVSVEDMGYLVTDAVHGEQSETTKLAVSGRGEVCFRGPQVFSGYYKHPRATAEVIDDEGWFHTGDIGVWLPDGRLKIVDRKKNIFKLSQGEYVAPERIENILATSALVEQVFVYGDSLHSVLVALVVPQEAPLQALAAALGLSGAFEDLCKEQKIVEAVHNNLVELSKTSKLFGFETIKAIRLWPSQFTVENNLLTPTFKLKRNECKKLFSQVIKELYEQCGDFVAGRNVTQV